jgi:lysophospholipid acyltransferase (LPLAT)-like uncharacterized protein
MSARGESVSSRFLGIALGLVARLWLATLRVRVVEHPALAAVQGRPWVLGFLHGTQWPLLAWRRRRRTVVLVSLSRDGALQARALAILGFSVVRGSSSRGGTGGLAAVVHAMKRWHADAAFAVDGPRGPYGVAKAGAVVAARATGALVVPMAGTIRRGVVLRRTWDRFALAWPFTRVDVALGAPIDPTSPIVNARTELERALADLNADLQARVARPANLAAPRRASTPNCQRVDLDTHAAGERRDLNRAARRVRRPKGAAVNLVDDREVAEIDKVDRGPDDVVEAEPSAG